ncbi:MAG: hypothetical protein ACYC5O_02030 [Anaerolineae bacterium]
MHNRPVRGMHDVRGMRCAHSHRRPQSDATTYVDMHRLMAEQSRLERELGLWEANAQRVRSRLADIAQEIREVQATEVAAVSRGQAQRPVAQADHEGPALERAAIAEMTLTY